MKSSYKIALVALPLAVATFILSRIIWPDAPGMMEPSSTQRPFFIFLSALESVSFGVGVGFLLFGWPRIKQAGRTDFLPRITFVAIFWTLVSWWPHDNMHRANGMDLAGLLHIEYIFHFTLILSGFIVAMFLWREINRIRSVSGSPV